MTVSQLIQQLQQYPPEMKVVAEGYEEGYDDIVNVMQIKIKPAEDPRWYVGAFDISPDGTGETVVFINGANKGKEIG